ncbi:DUF4198 domain-containing protein [Sphingomonas baiyangensis]|uniref:DUF4198 domain-containing protein n=1 Tax=Sphingomonas baiyangensis TaxID=2572576 RepID=A0A4U1L4X6_9SPHN|nr:DUF4198 domain-containing protein [Sphingomonas baiyangensis]TKD51987.1 DUF4198 domain-containing protein [Sphingomonas baiyangensis]
MHKQFRLGLIAAAAAIATLPATLSAHRLWMLPSITVVSSDDAWVTFDAAASNDLFHPDHQPLRAPPAAFAPDGSAAKIENWATGRYRSTFDLHLTQPGTWKVAMVNQGVMGSYTLNGEQKRLPRGTALAELAGAVPAGATEVKLTEVDSRNEVFVTSGAPTQTVLTPTGKGLELVAASHPNDLVASEAATFGFLVDGKPAPAGLDVQVIPGGKRYRDDEGTIALKTDAQGQVRIEWPGPGMYWLNVSSEGRSTAIPDAARRMGYTATIEVLPG